MAGGVVKVSSSAPDLLARKDIGEVFLGRTTDQTKVPNASGGTG